MRRVARVGELMVDAVGQQRLRVHEHPGERRDFHPAPQSRLDDEDVALGARFEQRGARELVAVLDLMDGAVDLDIERP